MARIARPWFRTERAEWCVNIRGAFHILGAHPDGYPRPRKVKGKWNPPEPILTQFHKLMSDTAKVPEPASNGGLSVADVMEKYLDWCSRERTPRTYEWYTNHLQSFADSLKDPKALPADQLKPFHIDEWLKDKSTWGAMHRRGGITAVQRSFTWAEDMGYIIKSPIRKVVKPAAVRREQVLTIEEFGDLLDKVKDEPFRDVLEFCWETGCRVQEVRMIEARHYNADNGRIEMPPEEAKGKKRWRYIYLTPRAEEIVKRLALKHPEGPLFRNVDDNQWIAQAFNNRFCRLQKKLGVKYALTAIRHSYATRMLEAGCDHLTVSSLLGHVDGTMLAKVYQHLGQKTDYLRQELLRVSNAENAAA